MTPQNRKEIKIRDISKRSLLGGEIPREMHSTLIEISKMSLSDIWTLITKKDTSPTLRHFYIKLLIDRTLKEGSSKELKSLSDYLENIRASDKARKLVESALKRKQEEEAEKLLPPHLRKSFKKALEKSKE